MKENIFKGALTVILAGAAVYFRQLLGPLAVLAVVMIADYITGMVAAWVTGTLSSRTGLFGIIKKICYLFAVGVAIVVDYIITFAAINAGAELAGMHVFGMLVTIWLILNECTSILENLDEIGVPLPSFLIAVVKKLKSSTEKVGDKKAKPAPEDLPEELPEGLDELADEDPYVSFGVTGDLPIDEDPAHPPDADGV